MTINQGSHRGRSISRLATRPVALDLSVKEGENSRRDRRLYTQNVDLKKKEYMFLTPIKA